MDERPPSAPVSAPASRPLARPGRPSTLGLLLVLAGVMLLVAQFVHVDLGHYGWPLFIIVPGVALLIIAVSSRGFAGEGLAILGSVLTITGLILLFQNATDHFESWAYAWALVFPGAVGIGMIIYGTYAGRPGNVRAGLRLLGIGLVLFLLGAAFFEGVIGIGGYHLGQSAGVIAGVLIIGVGAVLLLLSLISRRSPPP
jgi:hypothetical protein